MINKNCFGYMKNNTCGALNELFCKQGECVFYKDKEELGWQNIRNQKRIKEFNEKKNKTIGE